MNGQEAELEDTWLPPLSALCCLSGHGDLILTLQDELVLVFLSSGLLVTVLLMNWPYCLSSGTTAPTGLPASLGQGQEPHRQPWGMCAP